MVHFESWSISADDHIGPHNSAGIKLTVQPAETVVGDPLDYPTDLSPPRPCSPGLLRPRYRPLPGCCGRSTHAVDRAVTNRLQAAKPAKSTKSASSKAISTTPSVNTASTAARQAEAEAAAAAAKYKATVARAKAKSNAAKGGNGSGMRF
jgi:hypothetical protein